jgi:hypothetical protein
VQFRVPPQASWVVIATRMDVFLHSGVSGGGHCATRTASDPMLLTEPVPFVRRAQGCPKSVASGGQVRGGQKGSCSVASDKTQMFRSAQAAAPALGSRKPLEEYLPQPAQGVQLRADSRTRHESCRDPMPMPMPTRDMEASTIGTPFSPLRKKASDKRTRSARVSVDGHAGDEC